jgi:hypothetical protein
MFEHGGLEFSEGQTLRLNRINDDSTNKPFNDVQMYYDEICGYNFDDPKFDFKTGHFTQVVWKSTAQLGCFMTDRTSCPDGIFDPGTGTGKWHGDKQMTVCNYRTAGNTGNFADQVPRPKVDLTTRKCLSTNKK